MTNMAVLSTALRDRGREHLAVARLELQRLPFGVQLQMMLHRVEVLVAAFGASLAWVPFLAPGTYAVELHPGPADDLPHFGSCFARGGVGGGPWGANARSEWGAWAKAVRVNHACVVTPAMSEDRCLRQFRPVHWEVAEFEADVDATVLLVLDAARRLRTST